MSTQFQELGLNPLLVQTIDDLGYEAPTQIQASMIPLMLEGCDVIGQAQTGTGKTAAFALPMLQNIKENSNHIQGLVVAPTRELAMQVCNSIQSYGQRLGVRVLPVYGGAPYGLQLSAIRRGVDIVVGTPGRLLDLIRRGNLNLSQISTVVLDEADEMLSMGFIEDIEDILKSTPDERQTALFSATMPAEIRRIAERYLKDPQACTIQKKQLTVDKVEQSHYLVNQDDKLTALTYLYEIEDITSCLIFVKTRIGSAELVNQLGARGFTAEALSGDLSQDARERVLERFRNNQFTTLVATDVAARGLDIDDISHVINFDLPMDPEVYVHRVGRTGRAGKSGTAISLITLKDRFMLRKIENYTKQQVRRAKLPTLEDINAKREGRLMESMAVWLKRGRCRRELEMASEFVEAGFDPMEIAAVALKMARAAEKQRPLDTLSPVVEDRPRNPRFNSGRMAGPRSYGRRGGAESNAPQAGNSHEKGMVRMSLSTGRVDGVTISHIVGSLAHHADIPGKALGKISIQHSHTLVDVPERLVGQVMAKSATYKIGRQKVRVSLV